MMLHRASLRLPVWLKRLILCSVSGNLKSVNGNLIWRFIRVISTFFIIVSRVVLSLFLLMRVISLVIVFVLLLIRLRLILRLCCRVLLSLSHSFMLRRVRLVMRLRRLVRLLRIFLSIGGMRFI